MQWYFDDDGHQRGPAEEREVPDLIASGAIGADTLVWREGLADWEPAQRHFPGQFASQTMAEPVAARSTGSDGSRDYRRNSGLADAFRLFFRNYLNFSGRSNRGEFWFWALDSVLITIALVVVDALLFNTASQDSGPFELLWTLVTFIPSFAIAVRRLHDIGKSGWWMLLILVPVVGWIVLLVWYCRKPDDGPNRFA